MTRPTMVVLHSVVMDAAHAQPSPEAIAAVRVKTPPDLRAVIGFEPYECLERGRGRLRAVTRPAQFPPTDTHASGPPRRFVAGRSRTPQETHAWP